MNIKKVDNKPMVIHTKEKTKLHVKSASETKIKGRNVLAVDRSPKIDGTEVKNGTDKNNRRKSAMNIRTKGKEDKGKKISRENRNGSDQTVLEKRYASEKKHDTVRSLVSIGAKTTLDQMEGGNEVYESYMTARNLYRPLESTVDAGRRLYRIKAANAREKCVRKVQAGKKISKKVAKGSAAKATKETGKAAAKKVAKETAKTTVKAATTTAGTVAGSPATGLGGFLIGAAAGEVVGIAMDRKDIKNSTRNRMIQFFLAKLRREDNQDSIGKALKDIVLMRFFMTAKYIIRYAGLLLLALFILVILLTAPIIVVIAIIYNSPFAIFFPSISSGDTTQEVLSTYVAEFNREVNDELTNHSGYDESEKIYIDFEGVGIPDNYCDILAVYMVKYGNGDTATDMTDKSKENLKAVFDDMCSYSISERTETGEDEEGNTTTTKIKEVNVELKSYDAMIAIYGFDTDEQEMLAELMKPEYLALLGYTGGGGDPGESISPEQYQAIVDAISDANGKKVVEYAVSKVGYPYSQAYRDSGDYYDCSSLAYYAWQNAGINIMYEGSNTASAEGKYCYDNNLLVNYDEMQPGDLIFYSYEKNGRFMNISHVAIYVGNGMVVEAANTRLGVVYRAVQGKSSIVMIGRPR